MELLIRFKALGFTLVMPLLGAATASAYPGLAGDKVPALMGAALSYHLFSYILNDVIDLPVDRTEPLRAGYPLVKGMIEPWQALGLALVQIPLAGVFTAMAGGSYQAYVILGASFALMAAYNVWGKSSIFPPVTDLIQGLAWGGLTLYGAAATTDSSRFTSYCLSRLLCSHIHSDDQRHPRQRTRPGKRLEMWVANYRYHAGCPAAPARRH